MRNFESSSDEETGILKKALDVELPKNFNPKKTPTTGYLFRTLVIIYVSYLKQSYFRRRIPPLCNVRKKKVPKMDYSRYRPQ